MKGGREGDDGGWREWVLVGSASSLGASVQRAACHWVLACLSKVQPRARPLVLN